MSQILIAGFGGQGVLFTGRFIASDGLMRGKEVSWLPSYGPEMRGGTANCSVIISDTSIGSPIVNNPDILIAMNLPSLDKFENAVVAGGSIFIDSSLVERKAVRDDVKSFYIPSTALAHENGLEGLANMIMLGKVIRESGIIPYETISKTMEEIVPESRIRLRALNQKAIDIGYNYRA
ncbi:MAG: 2-oxoacid:acceptor oxidoreductase family protein [Eubacteriales bacterium]|jgi:2-oxoglutarate ferredoxin oxidoreductase subunit gamma